MYRLNRHTKPYSRRTMKQKHKTNPVMLKKLAIAFAITIIAVFCYVKLQPHTLEAKQTIQLEHKSQQLKSIQTDLEKSKVRDADTQKKLDDTNKQLQETQKQLEAKRNTATAYAAELVAPARVAFSGSCADWISGAGISDVVSAVALIQGESGCNPNSMNSSSGACGVAQELPCGKSGCSLGDGACQVKWMNGYVIGRYGSWANAYGTWLSRYPHWY